MKFARRTPVYIKVGLCIIALVGCTFNPPPHAYDGPPLPPKISYEYNKMSQSQIERTLHYLSNYQRILDHYIESISETILDREYISIDDRVHLCRATEYIKTIELPPKPNIRDDGRLSDDVIISKLADYIKQLTDRIKKYNARVDELRKMYEEQCRPRKQLKDIR